jgi:hypothetical protein
MYCHKGEDNSNRVSVYYKLYHNNYINKTYVVTLCRCGDRVSIKRGIQVQTDLPYVQA